MNLSRTSDALEMMPTTSLTGTTNAVVSTITNTIKTTTITTVDGLTTVKQGKRVMMSRAQPSNASLQHSLSEQLEDGLTEFDDCATALERQPIACDLAVWTQRPSPSLPSNQPIHDDYSEHSPTHLPNQPIRGDGVAPTLDYPMRCEILEQMDCADDPPLPPPDASSSFHPASFHSPQNPPTLHNLKASTRPIDVPITCGSQGSLFETDSSPIDEGQSLLDAIRTNPANLPRPPSPPHVSYVSDLIERQTGDYRAFLCDDSTKPAHSGAGVLDRSYSPYQKQFLQRHTSNELSESNLPKIHRSVNANGASASKHNVTSDNYCNSNNNSNNYSTVVVQSHSPLSPSSSFASSCSSNPSSVVTVVDVHSQRLAALDIRDESLVHITQPSNDVMQRHDPSYKHGLSYEEGSRTPNNSPALAKFAPKDGFAASVAASGVVSMDINILTASLSSVNDDDLEEEGDIDVNKLQTSPTRSKSHQSKSNQSADSLDGPSTSGSGEYRRASTSRFEQSLWAYGPTGGARPSCSRHGSSGGGSVGLESGNRSPTSFGAANVFLRQFHSRPTTPDMVLAAERSGAIAGGVGGTTGSGCFSPSPSVGGQSSGPGGGGTGTTSGDDDGFISADGVYKIPGDVLRRAWLTASTQMRSPRVHVIFATSLAKSVFSPEELASANVRGVGSDRCLDRRKLLAIHRTVARYLSWRRQTPHHLGAGLGQHRQSASDSSSSDSGMGGSTGGPRGAFGAYGGGGGAGGMTDAEIAIKIRDIDTAIDSLCTDAKRKYGRHLTVPPVYF